jgi:hypothetical protein
MNYPCSVIQSCSSVYGSGYKIDDGPLCSCGSRSWIVCDDSRYAECSKCKTTRSVDEEVKGYIVDGPGCRCGKGDWFVGLKYATCAYCDTSRSVDQELKGYINQGPECSCGWHGWFVGHKYLTCSHCDTSRSNDVEFKGYITDGPTCRCNSKDWFLGQKYATCSRCDTNRSVDQELRGYIVDGPTCRCGYSSWFVGYKYVVCSHCDKSHYVDDKLQYYIIDGPKCRCGSVGWFVGRRVLNCAKCDSDTNVDDDRFTDYSFDHDNGEAVTELTIKSPRFTSSNYSPLTLRGLPGSHDLFTLPYFQQIGGKPIYDENNFQIGLLKTSPLGQYIEPSDPTISLSGYRIEPSTDPNSFKPGFTLRDGDNNPTGFIDNSGMFHPFGGPNPFLKTP